MRLELKERFKSAPTLVFTTILAILSCLVVTLYGVGGYIFMPVAVSFLCFILLIDKTPYRILSCLCIANALIVDAIYSVAFSHTYTFVCLGCVICAFVLFSFLKKGWSKAFACGICTIVVFFAVLAFCYTLLGGLIGTYDPVLLWDYVNDYVAQFKAELVRLVDQGLLQGDFDTNGVAVRSLIDTIFAGLIAVMAVVCFLVVGVCCKILSLLLRVYSVYEAPINTVRFMPSALFAYFYLVGVILTSFIALGGYFALALDNLILIFSFVFGYIGFCVSSAFVRDRMRRPVLSRVLLIFAILIFLPYSLELLAIIGAIAVILTSKAQLPFIGNGNNSVE